MACAARKGSGSGSGRGRPPPPGLRALLLLLCLGLPGGRAAGPLPAPLAGVEQLLGEFRRQLQPEPPEELELELRAGGGPPPGCPGPGGGYSAMPDAIIRTKDSLAAGASFLSAPAAVRGWRQCVAACCSEPRCSVAVVELPRRPAPPAAAAALGCYLFNCTARGRNVCRFAPHRGYSSYSLGRAPGGQRDLGAGFPAAARASPRLGKQAPGQAGWWGWGGVRRGRDGGGPGQTAGALLSLHLLGGCLWQTRLRQDLWALLNQDTPCVPS